MNKATPCDRFEREGALQLERGGGLDKHIDGCADCRAARQAHLRVAAALHNAPMRVAPRAGWEARVFDQIAQARDGRSRQAWRPMVLGYAGMAAILLSALYAYFVTPSRHISAGPTEAKACPIPPEPPPAPAASACASLPPTPVPTCASARRVKVIILPMDADAEVEGTRRPIKRGILEIEGTLGSVHRVRIFKGTREVVTEVIVTDEGASPPQIELLFNKGATNRQKALPVATSSFKTSSSCFLGDVAAF